MLSRLQYISQGKDAREQLENISNALQAGCDWIQLRFKNADEKILLDLAHVVRALTTQRATFIINDNVQLAKAVNADGVHLGLTDMPVTEARAILGNKIIGGTANTYGDVMKRIHEKADYVGLGPFRFTTTKEKLSPVLGAEGYATIIQHLQKNFPAIIPIIAIGGITIDDVPALMRTGIHGVAVSGVLSGKGDKKQIVQQFKQALYGTLANSR